MASVPAFAVRRVPEVHFGPGRARAIADDAAALGDPRKPVVLIADRALVELGRRRPAGGGARGRRRRGRAVRRDRRRAHAGAGRGGDRVRPPQSAAGLVICLGGGSAMDVGKVAATDRAAPSDGPADFAMEGKPLPKRGVPKICLPTTAGTGSEFSSTNVFTNRAGQEGLGLGQRDQARAGDPRPRADHRPCRPQLTAWTGLDAFVHALEASTNFRQHAWNNLYAHGPSG